MDGRQNRLSTVGKLAEEGHNRPSTLRIQSTCRLIEEEQQRMLRCQFAPNAEELPLFNIQTLSLRLIANDGLGESLHVQHSDHLLDELIFLLCRGTLRLTENGREAESFSNGGSLQMQILLLDVSRASLKAGT